MQSKTLVRIWCEYDICQDYVVFETEKLAENYARGELTELGEDFDQMKDNGLISFDVIDYYYMDKPE